MKTLEQILEGHKTGTLSAALDGRDLTRLAQFLTVEQIENLGLSFKSPEKRESHVPVEFTKENILKQLEKDVAFGFEKALNHRGISSSLMYEVVQMWNCILEEGLEDFDSYAMYGLPLFKATAVKYGFDNPIGDDTGAEDHYEEQGY